MTISAIAAFKPMRALVRSILEKPHAYSWSVQGFGMLRTYVDDAKVWRLNVWSDSVAVPNVSTLHDHPWDFTSWVVAGRFTNQRFTKGRAPKHSDEAVAEGLVPWHVATIRTGPGGGMRSEVAVSFLRAECPERYRAGDIYQQLAEEIHESRYVNGTCTINERVRRPDGEHARVFWPYGQKWVDAEPRDATVAEVTLVAKQALSRFEEDEVLMRSAYP